MLPISVSKLHADRYYAQFYTSTKDYTLFSLQRALYKKGFTLTNKLQAMWYHGSHPTGILVFDSMPQYAFSISQISSASDDNVKREFVFRKHTLHFLQTLIHCAPEKIPLKIRYYEHSTLELTVILLLQPGYSNYKISYIYPKSLSKKHEEEMEGIIHEVHRNIPEFELLTFL